MSTHTFIVTQQGYNESRIPICTREYAEAARRAGREKLGRMFAVQGY